MSKKSIEKSIIKRCKKINKLHSEIVVDFRTEDIHAFRLEIKKLRAILRLLNENEEQQQLRIPAILKEMNECVGMIRNIQLLREIIQKQNDKERLQNVLLQLNDLENEWRYKAQHVIKDRVLVKEKKLARKIETVVKQNAVKKFVRKKISELRQLGSIDFSDTALHSIRKILKDITYNWPFIKEYATAAMPLALKSVDRIKTFTTLLGNLQDVNIFLELLHANNDDLQKRVNPTGIEDFKYNLFQQKRKLKRQVQNRLDHVNLQVAG